MNNEWYDQQKIECLSCGHTWILASNQEITDEEYKTWVQYVAIQHTIITFGKGEI